MDTSFFDLESFAHGAFDKENVFRFGDRLSREFWLDRRPVIGVRLVKHASLTKSRMDWCLFDDLLFANGIEKLCRHSTGSLVILNCDTDRGLIFITKEASIEIDLLSIDDLLAETYDFVSVLWDHDVADGVVAFDLLHLLTVE